MKIVKSNILLWILLITALSSCNQIDKKVLEKDWLGLYGRVDGNDFYYFNSNILSFKDGIYTFKILSIDSVVSFKYRLKGKTIYNDDTSIIAHIEHLSEDSMVLRRGVETNHYCSIGDYKQKISKDSIMSYLTDYAWNEKFFDENNRVDFTNYPWWEEMSSPLTCIVHEKEGNWYFREQELWYLKKYKDCYFMYRSNQQSEKEYLCQIKSIGKDKIEAINYSPYGIEPITFERIKAASKEETNKRKQIITSKEWKIDSIENPFPEDDKSGFDEYGFYNREMRGANHASLKMIVKEDFFEKKISYKFFENGNYEIKKQNGIIIDDKWKLSNNGEFIILYLNQYPKNYLRLIDISENKLTIGQEIELRKAENSDEYSTIQCIVKLK